MGASDTTLVTMEVVPICRVFEPESTVPYPQDRVHIAQQ
jgi:hypothetical protein